MTAPRHSKPGSNSARGATLGVMALLFLPAAASRGLELNAVIPDLAAPDLNGQMRGPEEFTGPATLILFWQPDRPRSRAALCDAARMATEFSDTLLVTIVSGRFEKAEIVAASESCTQRPLVLLDLERQLFGAFQIVARPSSHALGPL